MSDDKPSAPEATAVAGAAREADAMALIEAEAAAAPPEAEPPKPEAEAEAVPPQPSPEAEPPQPSPEAAPPQPSPEAEPPQPSPEAEPPQPSPEAAAAAPKPQPSAASSSTRVSPAAVALEAAALVSDLVDIDTHTGAVIAAAAAATAAAAAHEAGRADRSPTGDPSASAASGDPAPTVRLSRDRILQALAEDAPPEPGRRPRGDRALTHEPLRAPTPAMLEADDGVLAPGAADDDDFDPVQVAAAAIRRLRRRARTDIAELTVHYHRQDIFVVLIALVVIFAAGRVYAHLVTPPTVKFESHGLTFQHAAGWLPEPTPLPAPRLARGVAPATDDEALDDPGATSDALDHVTLTASADSEARIEILIDRQLPWRNIVTSLELDRRTRWGELYKQDASGVVTIDDHEWLRTVYHYAHGRKNDVPRVDEAIELATVDRDQSYVVTLFGTPDQLAAMEAVVAPTLRTATRNAAPLMPQTSHLLQPDYTPAVARAFDSTVMIVAADVIDGRLRPRAGGSGVIVDNGSILTSYHIMHDKTGRLHDVFVIGRYTSLTAAPQLWCAGAPSRSKLQRELDLALIKCDMDLDGRAWNPLADDIWPTLPTAQASDVHQGQRLWALGYPDVGGGGLTLTSGEALGWTGADDGPGRDYLKTSISTSNGNSGGPVVDDHGRLVGIVVAKRTVATATGGVVEIAKRGIVRPLAAAADLLAIAQAGWTPREGHTDVALAPTAVEAVAEGIHIQTKVQDSATEAPIRDAVVMVLRPGIKAAQVDINALDNQVLSWGQSNAAGEVALKQPVPVPGTYTVMVMASGYEPLIGENQLVLDANTPPSYDPWGQIWLRSR